jgi:hypothetical protein
MDVKLLKHKHSIANVKKAARCVVVLNRVAIVYQRNAFLLLVLKPKLRQHGWPNPVGRNVNRRLLLPFTR